MGLFDKLLGKQRHQRKSISEPVEADGEAITDIAIHHEPPHPGLPDTPPLYRARLRRGRPRNLRFAYHESDDWFRKMASFEEEGPRPVIKPSHY